MTNAVVICAVVASKDPAPYTAIDPDADNAWGTILGGDFAGQTPDRASALAIQKAFAIAIAVPVVIITILMKIYSR